MPKFLKSPLAILVLVLAAAWYMFKGRKPKAPDGKALTSGAGKYVVPDDIAKKITDATATNADFAKLDPTTADLLAAESWLYGFQTEQANVPYVNSKGYIVQANDWLSFRYPGWNSKPAGATPVIDGEGPKKAWIAALFSKNLGPGLRPGLIGTIPGFP